jgi:hypothetical protein
LLVSSFLVDHLKTSEAFHFDEIQFSFVSFCCYTFGAISKNPLPTVKPRRFAFLFSSIGFVILLLHLDFLFIFS